MKKKLTLISLNLFGFFLLAYPSLVKVYAAGVLTNPLKDTTLAGLIDTILGAVLQVGVVVVTAGIIYSGFTLVMARGKPGDLAKARTGIIWTIAGAAIVLGAYIIRQIVMDTVTGVFGA
ncbi:MAG: hypothetical protein WCV68_03330 [Candidatus Paceibacterota bacterium]|jgi:hypothetical protein